MLEFANNIKHIPHILGGTRLMIRCLDTQGSLIGMHSIDEKLSHLTNPAIRFDRALDDFVVNISDIADIGHLIALAAQPALNDIKTDQHAGMAQMAPVVHRHSTDI